MFRKFLIGASMVGVLAWGATLVSAGDQHSLYVYDFRGAGATVANQATANSDADMVLVGDWSSSAAGVQFNGNTTSLQSGGHAAPSSGAVIDVSASESVGAAVEFTRANVCPGDSQNISQIGPFAAGVSQIKLQLSKCVGGQIYPECRFAGALTPKGTLVVRGSQPVAPDTPYRMECVKSPDSGSSAQVVMTVTNLVNAQVNSQTFTIPATGTINSTRDVTVGNKYPLPSQVKNTDQYLGLVTSLAYCGAADVATTQTCLAVSLDGGTTPPVDPPVEPPVDPPVSGGTVDEVKYSYGDNRDEVVFSWRGEESTIYYGLTDDYGYPQQAVAAASAVTPVDIEGPFMEVKLAGLSQGTTYKYKIGENGVGQTFTTAAGDTDNFSAVGIGDTIASTCRSYEQEMFGLVASKQPDFVLHHGDIAIANECGVPAVHQFFTDTQDSFASWAAFMPAWGNHEYGKPTAKAPAGTPRDSLANYKGRFAIPNAQTVPNDTSSKTSAPGCGAEIGSSSNTCQGEDWGWFKSGRVLFVSFPEPWYNAINDWRNKVDALMSQAQADATIDFVVTYGHRPVLSSTNYTPPSGWDAAFSYLANKYSPSGSVPQGKYVLDLTGHRHNEEVFPDYHGIMQVVNGGGGQGFLKFSNILPGSAFRMKHLGFSKLDYDAAARSLTYSIVCGPSASGEDTTCVPGATVYSYTFQRP